MGLKGMGFSVIAIAAGAVMYWAVTKQGSGFRLSTVGVILMVIGAAGFVISSIVFAASRRPSGSGHHTFDHEETDKQGQTTAVHEEVR